MHAKLEITTDNSAGTYTESTGLSRWQDILCVLRRYTTPVSFDTWLSPLVPVSIDDDIRLLTLKTENDFVRRIVKERYQEILREAAKAVLGAEYRIEIES